MTKEEGLRLIRGYDGIFPEKYLADYLEYFNMSEEEFREVVNFHANTKILRSNPVSDFVSKLRPWVLKNPIGAHSLADMEAYG